MESLLLFLKLGQRSWTDQFVLWHVFALNIVVYICESVRGEEVTAEQMERAAKRVEEEAG